MRLRTDVLDWKEVHEALQRAKDSGKVAEHIHFEIFTDHGSRTHKRAFEIQLGTYNKVAGDKRGWKNSGTHGAGAVYAATYDEWGWFIAELYAKDENMIFGHYKGYDHFLKYTNYAYDI